MKIKAFYEFIMDEIPSLVQILTLPALVSAFGKNELLSTVLIFLFGLISFFYLDNRGRIYFLEIGKDSRKDMRIFYWATMLFVTVLYGVMMLVFLESRA